jgi:hypothetical protein
MRVKRQKSGAPARFLHKLNAATEQGRTIFHFWTGLNGFARRVYASAMMDGAIFQPVNTRWRCNKK